MAIVAGVDSSTQSTKIEVRDAATGQLLGVGRSPHPATSPPRSEQDPAAWWAAFDAAFAQACEEAAVEGVDAVSLAAQQHGLVALGSDGGVVRPAKLWNDTESAPDATALVEMMPADRWAQLCGSVPVAALTITKLAWLRRCEPDVWERVARVCLPHDWLTSQLTGRFTTDRGDASGTGYWSPSTGEYSSESLCLVDASRDWAAALPEVLAPTQAAGSWRGAVVAAGTGDNMAAALGLGVQAGDVVVSIGTSGTVFAVSDTPTADPTGAVAGFADATGRYLPLVCTLNATKVTDAVARLLAVDHSEMDRLALEGDGADVGPVLLPYFDGERTPNRPAATGWIAGLRSDVSRAQLARAAYDGVVCGLLDALDQLGRHVPTDGRLLLTGGGSQSAAYRSTLADLSGREVTVLDLDESVAAGACVQAVAALDQRDPLPVRDGWSAIGERSVTVPSGRRDRAGILERYRQLRETAG